MPANIDPFRGLRVEVVSQGRSFDLYDDPDAEGIIVGKKSYTRKLYVEGECYPYGG